MSLNLEESIFLERLRKVRPDLIEELKKEHYIEWKTKNKAKALAGIETTSVCQTPEDEKTDIEKAVSTRAKRIAMIS